MTEREQFDFLIKIGYDIKSAAELIKKMTEQEPNALIKKDEVDKEPEQIKISEQEMKEDKNNLEKKLDELKAEIKELRENAHKFNRENGVIDTVNPKPKTVDESVEELLKTMEV